MLKRIIFAILLILSLLALNGCFGIRIHKQKCYHLPFDQFVRAETQIDRIHLTHPHRQGSVKRLNILVYDGEDHELIEVALPLWLIEAGFDIGRGDQDRNDAVPIGCHVDWNDRTLKEIVKLGPGLVMEVEERNGESKVMIWLD